ncbi:MAG TPA: DUF2167 domain-containing protein [Aquabacterium sp.]|nr:DUF2167 domain-containing protein [Aquabacterium sp.]
MAAFVPSAHATLESDMEAAIRSVKASQVVGPADISLRDQATLKLPAGYVWVPEPAAGQMMRAMGNHPDEREMGLIFPQAEDQGWMVVADYEAAGYIKDDEAKDWNVDELFKNLKEGTEEANKDRAARGFSELEIVGWVEKPTYDAAHHRLVWSMSAKDKGAPADAPVGINYNTYALGREGYISLNLLTSLSQVNQDKPHVQTLLSALTFNDGKRYADFNASTDKVAEYGLAALVGGLAAKKIGLFALAAGLLAKFAKVIVLAGAAVAGVFSKFFKRKKDQA